MEVVRFIEKPAREETEALVRAGCFWNAGIFVFRPSRFLAEARRVAGPLLEQVEAYRRRLRERDDEAARRAYAQLPSVSIDYAVMERAAGVRAVPLRAGWNDVGSWRSVREIRGASDDRGNLILSDAPVLAPGVRDTAIVVTSNGVLVLPFDREGSCEPPSSASPNARTRRSPIREPKRSRGSRRKTRPGAGVVSLRRHAPACRNDGNRPALRVPRRGTVVPVALFHARHHHRLRETPPAPGLAVPWRRDAIPRRRDRLPEEAMSEGA